MDYRLLRQLVEADAPALLPRLAPKPPAPVEYGHGILPRIVADGPLPAAPTQVVPSVWSWPNTLRLIDWQDGRRADLRRRLAAAPALTREARGEELGQLVDLYLQIDEGRKLADAWLHYNRDWQADIAAKPSWYAARTALLDRVVERQALLAQLAKAEEPALRERELEMDREIHRGIYAGLAPPAYVTAANPFPTLHVVRLPVYTDIEDRAFVKRVQEIVERKWHVLDGKDDYRVELEFRFIAPEKLRSPPPRRGEHLDLPEYVSHFPADGAALTTGASSGEWTSRGYALPPEDLLENVLAHEFGHLLGFPDTYLRGFRDRGADGFDVLEIVPDPGDIMCAPGIGRVMKDHFETLLSAIARRPRK